MARGLRRHRRGRGSLHPAALDLAAGEGRGGSAAGDVLDDIEHLTGSEQADRLACDAEANVLHGRGGDDRLAGHAGDDTLAGVGGAHRLADGGGNDLASGGEGADVVMGNRGTDQLDGGAGDDLVLGGAGNDTAIYTGVWQDYRVELGDDGEVRVNRVDGGGVDRLVSAANEPLAAAAA